MKVTSSAGISFPSFGWGIEAGETKDLPQDKFAQEEILKQHIITKVDDAPKPATSAKGDK